MEETSATWVERNWKFEVQINDNKTPAFTEIRIQHLTITV